MESVLTEPAQAALSQSRTTETQPRQVNRANAYQVLKDQVLDLLYWDLPVPLVLHQLMRRFKGSPVAVRPHRQVPRRRKASFHRSYHLESCLMHEPDDDALCLDDTIKADESLGAFKHAALIRELIPKARDRWKQIHEADAKGEEFNYDDGLWDPSEKRWDAVSEEFNFYDALWKDIQTHPERYPHSK